MAKKECSCLHCRVPILTGLPFAAQQKLKKREHFVRDFFHFVHSAA